MSSSPASVAMTQGKVYTAVIVEWEGGCSRYICVKIWLTLSTFVSLVAQVNMVPWFIVLPFAVVACFR